MSYRFFASKLKPWKDIVTESVDCLVVAALCGSFNPMHKTHVEMYNLVEEVLKGTVWQKSLLVGGFVSPVNDGYEKEGLHSFEERAAVCDASLAGHPALSVDRWEGLQPDFVNTFWVLDHIQRQVQNWYENDANPNEAQLSWLREHPVRVLFVCGSDLSATFLIPGVWELPLLKRLLDNFGIVVYRRPGTPSWKELLEAEGSVVHDDLVEEDGSMTPLSLDLSSYSIIETDLLNSFISATDIRKQLLMEPAADLTAFVIPTAEELIRKFYGKEPVSIS
ncbi:hypothetical protein, conserved [Trypanosoma brucei gambiense DAL972]|uniref:Cytidyltransferase-like domain-containing protein n=2 Tax=Trypanosoma brucei TaxID=5691 RepID=C9ZPA6_TRYB9|nr:hypothetical protein, conserved [Trypanosoma brucei gambiense DAL972]RHW72593.1 cytidylyltransferase [Trypanosoma brucei equiperdum]CBH11234.1 hypothetical protein, conserved [Trypanosoma brucei gambiense DAL972]|eukprot:XP_011773521.1 hypothetical protein, conserved [Trypanosoma brucei gambiense DAL972]